MVLFHREADRALLDGLLEGDERAWVRFVHRFRPMIRACALRICQRSGFALGTEELNDLVSEVSLNLLARDQRRLRLYRSDAGASLSTWIGLITASTTRDHLRRRRRDRLSLGPAEELAQVASSDAAPDEILADRERREILERTLATLSDRDRQFVELYFAEAMSPQEIADAMGITVATVYSKKAKIAKRLLDCARAAGE
jgi:RNA polymerase sigma-70 factor (ECF subfamily)